jgi:hypothetical protein
MVLNYAMQWDAHYNDNYYIVYIIYYSCLKFFSLGCCRLPATRARGAVVSLSQM